MSPSTCSIITADRACASTGMTSERPVDVKRREREEQQLEPRARRVRVQVGGERHRPDDLHRAVEVGEAPGQHGERRPGGVQLVGGHVVVVEHVPDQRVRRVEVEHRVDQPRPQRDRVVVGLEALGDGQRDEGQTEHRGDPRQCRRPPHRLHGEEQHEQPEHTEHRPPQATGPAGLVLERRVDQHAEQLDGEQRRARSEAEEVERPQNPRERARASRRAAARPLLDPLLHDPDDTRDRPTGPFGSAGDLGVKNASRPVSRPSTTGSPVRQRHSLTR